MTFFHKGMTTEQRRRKVAEQARDSRGQWIEEGKNASTVINGKRYSGKVVGIYDGYAYLVPKKENPTHEPMPYRVPLKKVKMTNSKAVLPDKEKSRKARGAEALKGTKYEQMSDAEYAAEMERLDREYAKKVEAMLEGKATDEERQDRKDYREAIQEAKEAEKRGEIEPAPRTAPQREHSEQAKESTKSALSEYTAKVKEAYQGSRKDFTDVGHASYEDANGNKYYVSPRKEAEGPVMVVRDEDMKELFNVPVNESDTDDSVAQKILDEYDSEIDDNDDDTAQDRDQERLYDVDEDGKILIDTKNLTAAINKAKEDGDRDLWDRLTDLEQYGNGNPSKDELRSEDGGNVFRDYHLKQWLFDHKGDKEAIAAAWDKHVRRAQDANGRGPLNRMKKFKETLADLRNPDPNNTHQDSPEHTKQRQQELDDLYPTHEELTKMREDEDLWKKSQDTADSVPDDVVKSEATPENDSTTIPADSREAKDESFIPMSGKDLNWRDYSEGLVEDLVAYHTSEFDVGDVKYDVDIKKEKIPGEKTHWLLSVWANDESLHTEDDNEFRTEPAVKNAAAKVVRNDLLKRAMDAAENTETADDSDEGRDRDKPAKDAEAEQDALFPESVLDPAETDQDTPKRTRASRPTDAESTEQEMLPGFDGDEETPEAQTPEAPSEPETARDLMDGIIEVEKNNVGGNENTKWDTTAVYRDEQTGKTYNGEAKYIGKGQSGEYKNSNQYRAVIRDEDGNVVAEKTGATSEITRIMPGLVNSVAKKDREDAGNNAPKQDQESEATQPENTPEDAAQAPTEEYEGADLMSMDPETEGITINEANLETAIERAREYGDQELLDRLTDMDQFGNRRSVARNKYDRLTPAEGKSRLTGHNLKSWWGRNDREAQDQAINKFERRAAGARQEIDRLLNSDEFVRLSDLNRALSKHRRAVQDLNTAKQLRDPDWMELDRGVTRTERAVQAFKDKRAQERQDRQRQAAERRKGNLGAYMKYFDGLDKDSPERKALEYYVNKMNEVMKRTDGDLSGTATGRVLSNFGKAIQRQRGEALTAKPSNMTQSDANLAMKGQDRTNAPAEKRHESQYTGSLKGSDLIKYPGTDDRFISVGDELLYHYKGYRIVGEDGKMQDNHVPVEVVGVGAIGSGDVHVVPLEGHHFIKEALNKDGQIEVVDVLTREDILARAGDKNKKPYIKANPARLVDPNSSMPFINPTVDNGKGARNQSNDRANWRTADGVVPEKGMRVRYTMEKLRDGDEPIEQEGILFNVNHQNGTATIAKMDKNGNPILVNPEGNFVRDNIIKNNPSLKYVVTSEYAGPAPTKEDVENGDLPDLPDTVFRDPNGMVTARRGGETEAERLRSIEWGTRTEQSPDEEDLVEDVNPISNKPAAPSENITPSALVPVPKEPSPSEDSEAPFTAKVEKDSEETEDSEPTGAEEVRSAKVEPEEEPAAEEAPEEPHSAKVQPQRKSLRESNPAVFAFFNYLRENSKDLAESAAVANKINQLAKLSKSDRAMAGLVVRPRKASQFSGDAEFFTNDPARLAKVLDYYSAIAQKNNMPVPKGVSALRKDLDEFNNRMSDSAKVDARRGVAQSLLADLQRRNYIDIVGNGEVQVLKLDEANNHIKDTVSKINADIKELRKHPDATREMREAIFSRIEGVQDVEKALNDIVKEKAVKDGEDADDVTTIQEHLYVDLEDDA